MILNNTQANIFKVNGGIADNFANRPAASGSFYIFYSIDTQEIFYDNGSWVLLGSGGGGGVNIYNSNGTLTSNRTLSGANNDLNFADLNVFKTSVVGSDIGLKLDFANDVYQIGKIAGNGTNLYLDGANAAIDIYGGFINSTRLTIYDNNSRIVTENVLYVAGIDFDLLNNIYKIGKFGGGADTSIIVDVANSITKTQYQSNDIGLKLDFANSVYQFGQITGGGQSLLTINDTSGVETIFTSFQGNIQGFEFQLNAGIYKFGHLFGTNTPQLTISESNNTLRLQTYNGNPTNTIDLFLSSSLNDRLFTRYSGADNGIIINFSNYNYVFGRKDANNFNYLEIDDTSKTLRLTSLNAPGQYTNFIVEGGINSFIKTQYQNVNKGIDLNFASNIYQFGNYDVGDTKANMFILGNAIGTRFGIAGYGISINMSTKVVSIGSTTNNVNTNNMIFDNVNNKITTYNNNSSPYIYGIQLDIANKKYRFGQVEDSSTNKTYLTIDDVATYPVQLDGTNITSGTAGGASGQHLKIKLNGVDYKIELKNP